MQRSNPVFMVSFPYHTRVYIGYKYGKERTVTHTLSRDFLHMIVEDDVSGIIYDTDTDTDTDTDRTSLTGVALCQFVKLGHQ